MSSDEWSSPNRVPEGHADSGFSGLLEECLVVGRGGDLQECASRLRQLVERFPDEPDGYGNLAFVLQSLTRTAEAVECYKQFLRLRPQDPEALLRLGDSCFSLGDRKRAYQTYRQLKNSPKVTAELVESRLLLSESFPRMAVRLFRNSVRLVPRISTRAVDPSFWGPAMREIVHIRRSLPGIRASGLSGFLNYVNQHYFHCTSFRYPLTPCDLCGATQFTPDFFFFNQQNVHCDRCGLAFVERRPPDGLDEERHFYEQDETIDFFESSWWHDPEHLEGRIRLLRNVFADAGVAFPFEGGRVFEFGCAEGQVLNYLKECGMEVSGIEGSAKLVAYAVEHFGLNVPQSTVSQFSPSPGVYDVVLAYHVLEHLGHPSVLFKKAHELLRQGGFFFLEVPIPDLSKMQITDKLNESAGYACLGHMYYFTRDTIAAYLTKWGFSVLGTYEYPTPLLHGGFLATKN